VVADVAWGVVDAAWAVAGVAWAVAGSPDNQRFKPQEKKTEATFATDKPAYQGGNLK
jgi:hypothetical protein